MRIFCYENSEAHNYSINNNINCVLINNHKLQLDTNSFLTFDNKNRAVISPKGALTAYNLSAQFNMSRNVKVFNGISELSGSMPVGTGSEVRLVFEGAALDKLTLLVKGDLNGDSIIDSADLFLANKAISGHDKFEGVFYLAANLDEADKNITIEDYQMIENLALGKS